MKTFLLHLACVFVFATLLGAVGCGGGSGGDDDEEPTDAPPSTFDLSGKVLANDGSPIADAAVTARDGLGGVLATATSDADGTYSVRLPEMTPFYLRAEKAAYVNTNSHFREIASTLTGIDLVLLLQPQADSLLSILGGPAGLTPSHFLFLIRAVDPAGAELPDVSVQVTPIGLLVQYRLADDTGYSMTAPSVACTAGGGCDLPQMAGYSMSVDARSDTVFRMSQAGMGTIANVAAPLFAGEVTFVAND